jgi:hypothetical protein
MRMIVISSLLAMLAVGCAAMGEEEWDATDATEAEPGEAKAYDMEPAAEAETVALVDGDGDESEQLDESQPAAAAQRYCVDQSYASAQSVHCDLFWICGHPNWDSQLSRGHPVHIRNDCGTYVRVVSLWTGTCYNLRRDALRPC